MYAISNAAMEEEIRSRGGECASKDTKMTLAQQLCKLRKKDYKKNKPQAPAPITGIADALARAIVSPMIKLDIDDSATGSDGDGEGRADEFDEARAQLAEWMAEGKIVHGTSLFSLSHT